jgi:CDP-ribitol ribitolphosphotransferase
MSAVAQAQYVVMDDYLHLIHVLRIRSGVRVIQVWHAMGAMKKMGFSRVGRASNAPPRTSLLHRNYTDVIVSSPAMAPHYAEAFRTSIDKVHPLGAPRSDFFFDADAQELVRQELSAKVPALKDRRVVLFAPTYRDTAAHGCDYPSEFLDLDRVGETLEDQDLFVLKFHPFVRRVWQIPEAHRDNIIDLSIYPEFNHLLSVADLLVSDYSSAIFDCGLLRKPVVYYVPDMDTYDGARGFYYPFDQYVYGPVATTFDALLDNLSTVELDESRHQEFHDLFLQGCDGNATQRFFDQMLQPTLPQQNQRGER